LKFNSLKLRVLVWFGGVVALILILFSLSFRYFLNQSINSNIETKLYHEAIENLAHYLRNDKNSDERKNESVQIIILKDGITVKQSSEFDLKNINKFLKSNKSFYIFENDNDESINALLILTKDNYKVLIYQKDIDNRIENFEDTLFILNSILLIILIYTASRLIDKILLPIKKITKSARDISINNFSKTISEQKEDDEIKELVDSFNNMVKRLKDGVENLDRFNSDVSHELKTPLTVIKGEIEITLRKLREPQEYQKSMQTIYREANQMQKIVEDLLLLTRYSKDNIKDSFRVCSLDSNLLAVVDKFSSKLKEKEIALHLEQIEPISINANESLISSIFSNLIDNAIKYTPNGKNIYISLFKKKEIYFEIRDEGIGISEDSLSKITDRFYRVDESRNRSVKGFGLGLSIVKNGAELHNAKMKIESDENRGTRVGVVFESIS